MQRNSLNSTRKPHAFLLNTLREAMREMYERSSSSTFTNGGDSWMRLVGYCTAQHVFSQSGYPLVVVVESSQYWDSHHLTPRMLRGTRRSTLFRYLLLSPLMRSGQVEVCHILFEHALKLLLMKDE